MEIAEEERKRVKNKEDIVVRKETVTCIPSWIYQPDQWSPWNHWGKKKYSRHLLFLLRFLPLSLKKPANLIGRDDIREIVLEECIHELPKCKLCTCARSLPKSEMMPVSASSEPEKTAKGKEMEVVMEIIPTNFLSNAVGAVLNRAHRCTSMPVLVGLDMIRRSVSTEGDAKPAEISVSTSESDVCTPQNPQGRRKYDRDFLLKRHSHPLSQLKPKDLPHIEITLDNDPFQHTHCHVCELEASVIPVQAVAKTRVNDPKLLFKL